MGGLLFGCSVLYKVSHPCNSTHCIGATMRANHRITITYDLMDVGIRHSYSSFATKTGSGNFLRHPGNRRGWIRYPSWRSQVNNIFVSLQGLTSGMFLFVLLAYDRHTPSIQEMVDKVDISNLQKMLGDIVGVRHYKSNPNHLIYVGNYINQYTWSTMDCPSIIRILHLAACLSQSDRQTGRAQQQ